MLLTLPLLAQSRMKLRVELYLATECPISNRYVPELNRLAAAYESRGVEFTALFAEPDLTEARLQRWKQDYSPRFAVRLDPDAARAASSGATVTPQAVIFAADRMVYRGRIDDRYFGWGKARKQPQRRDVVETLDELLAGRVPAWRETRSWGCVIESRRR